MNEHVGATVAFVTRVRQVRGLSLRRVSVYHEFPQSFQHYQFQHSTPLLKAAIATLTDGHQTTRSSIKRCIILALMAKFLLTLPSGSPKTTEISNSRRNQATLPTVATNTVTRGERIPTRCNNIDVYCQFRCLILTTVSTCFGHLYAHHQEKKATCYCIWGILQYMQ